jgi:hypothetical protein
LFDVLGIGVDFSILVSQHIRSRLEYLDDDERTLLGRGELVASMVALP